MPVTLQIVTATGTKRVQITPTGKEAVLEVQSAKPTKIVIDPDELILKEVVSK